MVSSQHEQVIDDLNAVARKLRDIRDTWREWAHTDTRLGRADAYRRCAERINELLLEHGL